MFLGLFQVKRGVAMKRFGVSFVGMLLVVTTTSREACSEIIAATDFDGRTVSGATASNLTWTVNGVADPGDLTASANLFDTTAAQDMFAVNYNIQTTGPWTVDVPLVVEDTSLDLGTVTMDVYIFNGAGDFNAARDVDVTVTLLDATSTVIDTATVADVYPQDGVAARPQEVTLDLSGNSLAANTAYALRIEMSSDDDRGNNAGFDNLAINTNAVPEPASWISMLLAVVGLGLFRWWRR